MGGAVMATTITAGASVITPLLVEGFEAARSGGAIVHTILGRANPDVTLRPAGTRTGAWNSSSPTKRRQTRHGRLSQSQAYSRSRLTSARSA